MNSNITEDDDDLLGPDTEGDLFDDDEDDEFEDEVFEDEPEDE